MAAVLMQRAVGNTGQWQQSRGGQFPDDKEEGGYEHWNRGRTFFKNRHVSGSKSRPDN